MSKNLLLKVVVFLIAISCNYEFISSQTKIEKYIVNGSVDAIVNDSDGNTFVGGSFSSFSLYCGSGVEINTSTAIWSDLEVKVNGIIYSVVPVPQFFGGGWYIGGSFTSINGETRNRLARINSDGTLHSFNPNMNGTVYSLDVNPSGDLYAGGMFTSVNGSDLRNRLAKFNSDGSLNTFNPNMNGIVYSLKLDGSNNLYVGGSFTQIGVGDLRNRLAKFNSDGSLNSFNPNMNSNVRSICIYSGFLWVGGEFTYVNGGGTARNKFAEFEEDGLTSFDPNINGNVYSISNDNSGNIYIGGDFTYINGGVFSRNRFVKFNSDKTLNSLNPDINNVVTCIAVDASNNLYIGGYFTTINGSNYNRIAKIHPDGTLESSFNPNFNSNVLSLALNSNNEIYIGGDFTTINAPILRNRLAKINSDGTLNSFNPDLNNNVNCLTIDASGNLYVGGNFTTVNGSTSRNYFAKFNSDGTLNSFNPNIGSDVRCLLIDASNNLYMGGNFTTVNGGTSRNYFAKFNSDGTLNSFNPNFNNLVRTFVIDASGNLYFGGNFTTVNGGTSRNYFAKFNSDETLNSFNPNFNGILLTLKFDATNNLYAGGNFTTVNGSTSRNYFAKFNSDGTLNSFNPNMDSYVYSVAFSSSNELFLGGNFSTVNGGTSRSYFAMYNSDGTLNSFSPNIASYIKTLNFKNGIDDIQIGCSSSNGYFSYRFSCIHPTIDDFSDDSACGESELYLEGYASSGVVNWYDQAVGGTLLHIGNEYETPTLSSTTSYWAEALDGTCASLTRTEVVATINEVPPVDQIDDKLVNVKYFLQPLVNGNYYNGPIGLGSPLSVGDAITSSQTIYVIADNGFCKNQSSFKITILTSLSTNSINKNLFNIYDDIYARTISGANKYKFKITDINLVEYEITSLDNKINLSEISATLLYGTYSIKVAYSTDNGLSYTPFGNAYNVHLLTKLKNWYCGTTTAMNSYKACYTVIGATKYRYKLVDGATTLTYIRYSADPTFRLSWVTGIQNNKIYTISVSTFDGTSWSAYGSTCIVTTPASGMIQNDDEEVDLAINASLTVYPNPNNGSFTISASNEGSYVLINELGQKVQELTILKEKGLETRVEGLKQGVYFVIGTVNNEVVVKKVVVQ